MVLVSNDEKLKEELNKVKVQILDTIVIDRYKCERAREGA